MIMDDVNWWISGFVCCVICSLVGVTGNALTIALFVKNDKFRNHFGYFVFSLTLTDFVTSIFVIPLNSVLFIHQGKWKLGHLMCTVTTFLSYGNVSTSSMLICFIAINRFVRICCSQHTYERFFSLRTIVLSNIFAWVYTHLIIGLSMSGVGGELIYKEDTKVCEIKFHSMWGTIAASYIIQMVTIAVCYIKIYAEVKSSRARVWTVTGSQGSIDIGKLFKTLVVTTVAYSICSLMPLSAMAVADFSPGIVSHAEKYFFLVIPFSVSVFINPIIYGCMSKQYLDGYAEILRSILHSIRKTSEASNAHSSNS